MKLIKKKENAESIEGMKAKATRAASEIEKG